MFAHCSMILHDPDAVQDALQLTYTQLWELLSNSEAPANRLVDNGVVIFRSHADGFPPKRVAIKLLRLAEMHVDRLRKSFLKHLERHLDLQHALELPDAAPSAINRIAQRELTTFLNNFVSCLSPPHREILHLYFSEGFTHAKIGRILGLDRTSVTKRLQRAVEELQFAIPHASEQLFEGLEFT